MKGAPTAIRGRHKSHTATEHNDNRNANREWQRLSPATRCHLRHVYRIVGRTTECHTARMCVELAVQALGIERREKGMGR